MVDISKELQKVILEKQCSPLLALIVIKDELHIQESKSCQEFSGRLCDTRDMHPHK